MTEAHSVPELKKSAMLVMAAASALTVANVYFNQALLPAIALDFGASSRDAGLISTLSQLGYALGIVLVVPLGDRGDPRVLVRMLLVGVAAALLAASYASKLWILASLSFAIAMGTCVPQIVLPLAAGLAPPAKRGHVIASVQTGLVLGILLSRTLAGIGASNFGWRSIYVIAAALMSASAVLLPAVLPRRVTASETTPYFSLLRSLFGLLRRENDLRLSCMLGAAMFATFSAFWTSIPFHLAKPPFHLDLAGAGYFALWGGIGGLASLLAGGWVDRFGQDRVSAGAVVLALVGIALVALLPANYMALVVGGNFLSFALSAGQIANQARIFGLGEVTRSRLNTIYMGVTFVGGAFGSAGAGALWAAGGWTYACGLGFFCLAIAAIALARARMILMQTNRFKRNA